MVGADTSLAEELQMFNALFNAAANNATLNSSGISCTHTESTGEWNPLIITEPAVRTSGH